MSEQHAQEDQRSKVGIVGGGKVGLQLLGLFSTSQLTRVSYVVDRDTQAPAMVSARQQNIPTYTEIEQAIHSTCVDYVFEVTGVEKVLLLLKQSMAGCSAQLVTHDMASVILRVVEENRQRSAQVVQKDILEIRKEISSSLEAMADTLDGIKETTNDLRYLALNARIEAARAGDQGRGFDVVAQQVEQSAQDVRVMTGEIEDVNRRISAVSSRIDESLQKMR